MQKLAIREAIWILVGIATLVLLMTLADSAEPALPNCPTNQTTNVRCAP